MDKAILLKYQTLEKEYIENEKKLIQPNVLTDFNLVKLLGKRQKELIDKVELYRNYLTVKSENKEAEELLKIEKDPQLIKEFKQIYIDTKKTIDLLEKQLIEKLKPVDPNDQRSAIIEIQSAAGGDEAKLFALDLFKLYHRYATKKHWTIKVDASEESEGGGYSFIAFEVRGKGVYKFLKYESGVHRVQRIPETETQGRIHTSTVTVFVYPKLEQVMINLNPAELRIDTYRASGAGGQHVNKTDSAVRVTHIPTGLVAQSQDGRSQHDNKEKALTLLANKLQLQEQQKQKTSEIKEKQAAVGTGERSQKIRTYNYPQNRITDHRIGLTIKKLDRIMEGDLDEIINPLMTNNLN